MEFRSLFERISTAVCSVISLHLVNQHGIDNSFIDHGVDNHSSECVGCCISLCGVGAQSLKVSIGDPQADRDVTVSLERER